MNDEEILGKMLNEPDMADEAWVLRQIEEHPAFFLPALILLKHKGKALDEGTRQLLQQATVLNCGDSTALADYIDPVNGGWATFYPQQQEREVTTEETINDFLQTFGTETTPEEDAVLERILFNPIPDYFAGTDEPYDPNDPLALPPELLKDIEEAEEVEKIDYTIEIDPKEEPEKGATQTPTAEAEGTEAHSEGKKTGKGQKIASGTSDDSSLMESLAKIFIKQRRYERAFEIISKLSLKYPEKSVYFADQLRFLQKLMINQQHLTKQNQQ